MGRFIEFEVVFLARLLSSASVYSPSQKRSNQTANSLSESAKPFLVHVHTNEPDLGELGVSGAVNNHEIARLLKSIGYNGYVSLEQRMVSKTFDSESIRRSIKIMKQYYL